MSATKFTPEVRGGLLERAAAGVSLADSCQAVGLRLNTAKSWIARGRRETDGVYAEFAEEFDAARRAASERPEPLTEDELRRLVSQMVRQGSVAAAKLYWTMLLTDRGEEVTLDVDHPLAELDELRARRAV